MTVAATKMKTAIVILNWNGRKFLEDFLPGLIASVGQPALGEGGKDSRGGDLDNQVIVADNASTDGSLNYLKDCFPNVKTIALDRNYGFTGGYNRALKQVDAEYYILINSDVEVEDGWLQPLLDCMEYHPECGICSPKLRSYHHKEKFEYAGAAGGYLDRYCFPFCRGRVMDLTEEDKGQYDSPTEVLWSSGACLMIRSELYHALNGLDERFFAHMEEIDLCWRARLDGYKVYTVPRSVVYHIGGGTLPNNSERKLFFNYRNNLLMMSKNLPQTMSLLCMFELAARLEPIENYSSDPFRSAIAVYESEDRAVRKTWFEQSVKVGMAEARWSIFQRKILDNISALAYLFQGKPAFFRAVRNAHKEYKVMKKEWSKADIEAWLKDCIEDPRLRVAKTLLIMKEESENMGGEFFKLKGMYSKFIVWQKFRRGMSVFEDISQGME